MKRKSCKRIRQKFMKLIFIRKQKNLPLNMKTFHKNMKFGITGKLNVKEKKERFASNRFYLIFAH